MSSVLRMGCGLSFGALALACAVPPQQYDAGPPPAGQLVAAALDFGPVALLTSSTEGMMLANDGGQGVQILGVFLDGPAADDFGLADPVPSRLAPGATASLAINFSPAALGLRSATLEVTLQDSSVVPIALSGTGTAQPPTLTPASFAFGPVPIGGELILELNASNPNPVPLAFLIVPPAPDSGFSVEGPFGETVQPEEALVRRVSFVPQQPGLASGSLTIAACDGCPAATVALSAQGIAPPLAVSPSPLVLPAVGRGRQVALTATLTNVGPLPAQVDLLDLQAGDAGRFALAQPPVTPFTLDAGDSLSLQLTYGATIGTPVGTVDQSALELGYQLPGADAGAPGVVGSLRLPVSVEVRTDCQLALEPPALHFGLDLPGRLAAVPQQVQVRNVGSDRCALLGAQFVDGGDPAFQLLDAGALPSALARQQSIALTFGFASSSPTPLGTRSALFDLQVSGATFHLPLDVQVQNDAYALGSPCPRWRCDNANSGRSRAPARGNGGAIQYLVSLPGGRDRAGHPIPVLDLAQPTVTADGTVILVTGELQGSLAAIHSDGEVAFEVPLAVQSLLASTTPALAWDGEAYVLGGGGYVEAFTAVGLPAQDWPTSGSPVAPLALDLSGRLVIGDQQAIGRTNLDGGAALYATATATLASLAVADDGTVFADVDGGLAALELDGGQRWQQALSASDAALIALSGGHILLETAGAASGDDHLHLTARAQATGAATWDFRSAYPATSWKPLSPAVRADGAILLLTVSNPDTGAVTSQLECLSGDGGPLWATGLPTVVGAGTFVGASQDGYALAGGTDGISLVDPSGTLLWTLPLSHGVAALPILGPDGTLWVWTNDNSLYGIR